MIDGALGRDSTLWIEIQELADQVSEQTKHLTREVLLEELSHDTGVTQRRVLLGVRFLVRPIKGAVSVEQIS